jgi:hypothetical protein
MKIPVFWDVTPFRLVNGYRRFERAYCLLLWVHAVLEERL